MNSILFRMMSSIQNEFYSNQKNMSSIQNELNSIQKDELYSK